VVFRFPEVFRGSHGFENKILILSSMHKKS